MAKELVTDELWQTIEPLLPPEPPKLQGGRPRIDNRAALTGIVFVLKSGIPWEMLPKEMGCGSGMTCWRRLKEWHEAGVESPPQNSYELHGHREPHRVVAGVVGLGKRCGSRGARRSDRTQRIEVNEARSVTWWSTVRVFCLARRG